MRYVYLLSLLVSVLYPHLQATLSNGIPVAARQAQATQPAKNVAHTPAESKPDYSKEPFVEEDYSMKVAFENDGTGSRTQYYRVRIQSDAGVQHYGVLTFPYESASENIAVDFVRVRKTDGSVVVTGADGIQDMPAEITRQAPYYSDLREKQVAVKGLGVGDVLEAQVRWQITKPLIPGQFWFLFNFSHDNVSLHEELQISVPKERPVKWASPSRQPSIATNGDRETFTWMSSQLQSKSAEEQKKDQDNTTYETATGQLPLPDVQISSFQNWAEIGAWYNTLQRDRVVPDAAIRAKAAEITKGAPNDTAKLRAICDYVSTQIRYIGVAFGIGRYQPHAAGEILANAYGDCKDKHTLLASLLAAAGIKAYPALINSARKIDPTVPSPAAFDHVITVVPQGKDFVWLDTTPEVAPYGYLLGVLRNKQALVITDNEPAALMLTPASMTAPSVQTFRIDATLGSDGVLKGKIERSIGGSDIALLLRTAFRNVSVAEWQTLVQRISYASGFGGDVSDVTVNSLGDIEQPLTISYTYTRKDFPQWSEHRVDVALPPMLGAVPSEKPSHPVLLGDPGQITYESRIHVPKGYTPQLPAVVDVKQDFADYHASYSRIADGFAVTRTLVVKMREVPVADFTAYKAFSKAVSDDSAAYVAFTPVHVTVATYLGAIRSLADSPNDSATQAYQEAMNRFSVRDVSGVGMLEHAVELDPKFTRARLALAETYLMMRRTDDAIGAFRAAVNNDPKQPLAYKGLGFALMSARKFDDAATVWKQLMQAVPDDPDAPEYLGEALSAAKRYAEAAVAFQSAMKLNPKSASLYTQLGSAYLQAGDDAKAMAAYKQALALDSSSLWLNNIGYALADANKQLPLALQYIQKAVQQEEADSAKVKLSDLQTSDLNYTTSLAAYWDSLGWAYFRMDNLRAAEKYLDAAWVLSESATIGDHLGQLFEKEHRKKQAVETLRLALSASVDPELKTQITDRLLDIDQNYTRSNFDGGAKLSQMRTSKVPGLNVTTGSAEFFLLFGSESRQTKVEDVKFISGSDELKDAGKSLRTTDFGVLFPDDGPERLLRRGILSCDAVTKCTFVLYAPGWVRSVN